jgi:hypothetical protein
MSQPRMGGWGRAKMGKKIGAVVLIFCVVVGTGCAQMMAACKPGPLDRSVLEVGAHRSGIVAALGSGRGRLKEGSVTRTEHYYYTDGGKKNTVLSKVGRIVLYTAGDVFTLFLSQILFMPFETVLEGTQYRTSVDYQLFTDGTWRVQDFTETSRGKDRPDGLCN